VQEEVKRVAQEATEGTASEDPGAARPGDALIVPPTSSQSASTSVCSSPRGAVSPHGTPSVLSAEHVEEIDTAAEDVAAASSGPCAAPGTPSPADVRTSLAAIVAAAASGGPSGPPTSCIALTLLCMARGWEARASDLFAAVFSAMPDHDWLVVTLPYDEAVPAVMSLFDCLVPLPASPFPHKLYVMHRCSSPLLWMGNAHC
jgi:hypothetical protein